ncbi:MAG TPA: PAS domain S-box protein, partial [Gemmataceae bacterium]|nr:PAS domain S-box protein [Gemmataceae bacterium]
GTLRATLQKHPDWDKELVRVDQQIATMQQAYDSLLVSLAIGQRLKLRADYQQARAGAIHQVDLLRTEIAQKAEELAVTQHARWQAVGAAALTGVVLCLGCVLMWLVFDRELRRTWKEKERLSESETRYRSLIENQSEPIAIVDPSTVIAYANPAWKTAFGYELDEVVGANLLELIHPDDRVRVRTLLLSTQNTAPIPCRLSADYGVYHDVELVRQAHTGENLTAVRVRDVRETSDVPIVPHAEMLPHDPAPLEEANKRIKFLESRVTELEADNKTLHEREAKATDDARHHRWLLGTHKDVGGEGILIVTGDGKVLSWNHAFVQMWKLSDATMSGHSWMTIAAHMETLVNDGWADFRRAADGHGDSCWEMSLEGSRRLEVYAQAIADHPQNGNAIRFHFRDVTRQQQLESDLRDHQHQVKDFEKRIGEHEEHRKRYESHLREHEERGKSYESNLREHEKRLKHLERQLEERDRNREELETTLREHQDRLHEMHERHTDALTGNKEVMRRLATGVANDFNNVLSVIMGNTDVLSENLPKDHVAQNYVEEIRQAAHRGAELSQRLLAFSRNHLLQMMPTDLNAQLEALQPKIRTALGHDVQLDWQPGHDELWVKTDPAPLEQAILHLVAHAKGHMPDGGTLTMRTSRVQLGKRDLAHADMTAGSYVQIQLRDTGAGIADETLAHVFEPYQPVHDGHKGDLTLATAYGILRQSGGCIEVSSEKGRGSAWTILLPETTERSQHVAA